MADKLQIMLEAERRGILPPDKVAVLGEARKRGLVGTPASVGPKVSGFGSFGLGMADMASFGFDDEIRAAGRSLGKGIPYSQALDEMRSEHKAAREQNPKSYIAGQVTGGVVPALATGGQSVLQVGPVARAAITGGVQGGLYGAGSGEGEIEDRLGNAAKIGTFGALGGAGITYGLSLLGRAVTQSASKLAGSLDDIKGTSPPPVDTATKKVIDKLRADFPDDAEYAKALAQVAKGGTLAEVAPQGGQIQRLTRGAAQYPSGEKAITETLTERASGSSQRLKQGVKDYISPNNDFYGTIDKITQRGQAKARPLYEKAYQETVDLDLNVPEIQQAIQKARSQYPSELQDLPDNSIKVLDYAKRVLDDDIGVAKRAGEGNFARSRTGIKNALLEKIDSVSPTYAKARKVSGDYLSNNEALETGREFMKMDADIIGKTLKSFNAGQKESFKAGVARSVRDIIDKSPDGADISKRILGKEEVRNKLKAVMSPSEYNELANTIRAEEKIFKLQKFVLGNSTTTSKAMDAADISSEAQDIIETIATRGPKAAGMQQIVKAITKIRSGLNDKTAGDVAKILMEENPQKKLALLTKLKANPKGQNQQALEVFFETNKAIQNFKKTLPSPELTGVGAGTIAGAASPLEVTVRPSEEMKRRNLTTKER